MAFNNPVEEYQYIQKKALRNYEIHFNLQEGQATMDEVKMSKRGIMGFANVFEDSTPGSDSDQYLWNGGLVVLGMIFGVAASKLFDNMQNKS